MEMAGEILGQLLAACVGTAAFSALFGVPKKYWLDCGICGAVGWGVYLAVMAAYQTPIIGTFAASAVLTMLSRCLWIQSRWRSQSGWGSERHIRFRDICLDGRGR